MREKECMKSSGKQFNSITIIIIIIHCILEFSKFEAYHDSSEKLLKKDTHTHTRARMYNIQQTNKCK